MVSTFSSRSYRRALFAGAVAALLAQASFAAAAQPPAPVAGPTSNDVGELIVRGRSIEETLPLELSRQGSDIEIATAREIKDKGYADTSEVLQMEIPGLFVSPQQGPFSYADVALQGGRQSDVLWLVDGVRISNRLYAGTPPTDTLPVSMIERVEVLKGGQGLFYGTQATAGVINVVTRSFSDRPDGEISFGADGNDGFHVSAMARRAAGNHKFVAYVSNDQARGYEVFTTYQPSATDRLRSYNMSTIGLKYGYDLGDNATFSLRYQHTGGQVDFLKPALTAAAYNTRDEDIISANFDYKPSDTLQIFAKAYLHYWDSHINTINNVIGSPGVTTVVENNLFWGYNDKGLNLVAQFRPGGPVEYSVGYDYQTYDARDDSYHIDPNRETVNAFFAQVRSTSEFSDRLRLAAGVRNNDNGASSTTVWNLSGRFDVTSNFYVEATGGTSFVLPTAEQLFLNEPGDTIGNPNLKPETSESYNVSIGGVVGRFNWQATIFNRKITDLIDYVTPSDPLVALVYPSTFDNIPGVTEYTGYELQLEGRVTDSVSLGLSYSHNDNPSQRVPDSFVKAELSWRPADRNFGGSVSVLSMGNIMQSVSGFGVQNLGNYTVVDLGAFYYLDPMERRHRLGLRVQNLFDESYNTLSRADRNIDGTATKFLYGIRGVPRTISVNYSLRF